MNLVRKSYLNFVTFILMNVQIKIQHTPKEIESVYFLVDLCNLEQQLRMEAMERYDGGGSCRPNCNSATLDILLTR